MPILYIIHLYENVKLLVRNLSGQLLLLHLLAMDNLVDNLSDDCKNILLLINYTSDNSTVNHWIVFFMHGVITIGQYKISKFPFTQVLYARVEYARLY